MAEALETAHVHRRGDGGQWLKINCWPDGSISPGNYGWLIICELVVKLPHTIYKDWVYDNTNTKKSVMLLLFSRQRQKRYQ
jgi:hypothetical protein